MMPNDLSESATNTQEQKTTEAKEKAIVSNKYFDFIPYVIWIREIAKHLGLKSLLSLRLTSTKFYTIFTKEFTTLNSITILNGKQETSADFYLLQKYKLTLYGAFYRFIYGENSISYLHRKLELLQKQDEATNTDVKQRSSFIVIKNALNITSGKEIEELCNFLLKLEFPNLNRDSIEGDGAQQKYEAAVNIRDEVQLELDKLLLQYINKRFKSSDNAELFEDENNKRLLDLAREYSCNFDVRNRMKWTALSSAAIKGHTEIVKLLLNAGADVSIDNLGNGTDLMKAAENGHTEIVKLLFDAGDRFYCRNWYRQNMVLINIIDKGNAKILEQIIKSNVDFNIEGIRADSALIHAVTRGRTEMVKLLLGAGADVNLKGEYERGSTALMCAAFMGNTEIAKLLLEAGADIDVKNDDGYTALNCAEDKGHHEIKSLVEEYKKNTTHPSFINSCHICRIDFLLEKQLYKQSISYINKISSVKDLKYMHSWVILKNLKSNTPNDDMAEVIAALELNISNLALESSNNETAKKILKDIDGFLALPDIKDKDEESKYLDKITNLAEDLDSELLGHVITITRHKSAAQNSDRVNKVFSRLDDILNNKHILQENKGFEVRNREIDKLTTDISYYAQAYLNNKFSLGKQ